MWLVELAMGVPQGRELPGSVLPVFLSQSVHEMPIRHRLWIATAWADHRPTAANAAYAARTEAGHVTKDNFGMWVGLDQTRVGSLQAPDQGSQSTTSQWPCIHSKRFYRPRPINCHIRTMKPKRQNNRRRNPPPLQKWIAWAGRA